MAVGEGVMDFKVGDRVASNGSHAEFVCVPQNLVAMVPETVSDEEAAFTVIGSIGLQGIRNLQPQIGETVVVVGLGLIGLIAAQLLKANGCNVIGTDFDQQKVDLACSFGIKAVNPGKGTDAVKFVLDQTNNIGADGILITAASKSDEIIHEACEMSRKRGKIVLVGVIGLNLRRDDFYKKELSFQVSCSYGAGRYDENYENKGIDYPIAYARWTEKRNFEVVLNAIANGTLDVKSLITEVVELEKFDQIYGDMRKRGSIASIIKYPVESDEKSTVVVSDNKLEGSKGVLGIIGAGNYTGATVIPALKKANVHVKYISARTNGLEAKTMAKKMGAEFATTNYMDILNDKDVDMVICTTRHDSHAKMILDVLNAGKSIFVEKPLCLNQDELDKIIAAYQNAPKGVTINAGFNRRFSPFAVKMKELLGEGPKNIVATMNAGFIPKEVWVHDMQVGGGRIIGEGCHFIDLCTFLAGSKVTAVCVNALGEKPEENTDNMSILLKYENGSNAVVNYFGNGSKAYPKERLEVFYQEKVLVLDNWRKLQGYGFSGFSKMSGKMDKGHAAEFALLNDRVKNGGDPLIPFEELVNATKASFACITSLKENRWVNLDE